MNEKSIRHPLKGATGYRVRLRAVASFRRAGVEFTTENTPYDLVRADVEAEAARRGLAAELLIGELLNTPTLDVEELGGARAAGAKDVAK